MNKTYTDGFFNISSMNGFLPVLDPLRKLPSQFKELQDLINDLPQTLLIPNKIVERVNSIPYYDVFDIDNIDNIDILQALFRAYTFITSSYTLELSYQTFLKTGKYGEARRLLPKHIAKPLVMISEKLKVYPWLDYHYAYSLGNYVKKDTLNSLHWKNLDMACKFIGSTDEIGFIMLHVYINELSPQLVNSVIEYSKNFDKKYLEQAGFVMEQINQRRREMWEASRPNHYNDFRVFIMGIKGNTELFGEGLVYEDCFNNQPQQFRGQTGAQDSIIPMMDIFTGVVDFYPNNKLTEYLLDLRSYRPVCVQDFFKDLRDYYSVNPIYKKLSDEQDIEGLLYLLKIVDEIYLFRNGHWQFVQKYIMENTDYPMATGGTPITSWLINQIESVLEFERVIIQRINEINNYNNDYNGYNDNKLIMYFPRKIKLLKEQTEELNKLNYNVQLIYTKNKELELNDI
jgi:indoleamine 2,3-dioxygenase